MRYFAIWVKEIIGLGLEKHSDYIIGLRLTLWYVGFALEKYSDYLAGLDFIFVLLILYVWLGLEKYSEYLAGFGLILKYIGLGDGLTLLNIGLRLVNEPSRKDVTKVWWLSSVIVF